MDNTKRIAILSVTIAIVAVFTFVVKIPTPGGGYINAGDVAIFFVSFTFGPFTAFVSAAFGSMIADVLSGYAQWAPISFIVHGLEGLLVAFILKTKKEEVLSKKKRIIKEIGASFVGVFIVSGGYFLLSGLFIYGFTTSLVEVPMNIAQSAIGAILGLALSESVRKAYPALRNLSF